jgi:hypothetical protein
MSTESRVSKVPGSGIGKDGGVRHRTGASHLRPEHRDGVRRRAGAVTCDRQHATCGQKMPTPRREAKGKGVGLAAGERPTEVM